MVSFLFFFYTFCQLFALKNSCGFMSQGLDTMFSYIRMFTLVLHHTDVSMLKRCKDSYNDSEGCNSRYLTV